MLKINITTLLLILSLSLMAKNAESLSATERHKMAVANRHFERQDFPKAIKTYEKFYLKQKLTPDHKIEYAMMLLTKREAKMAAEVLKNTTDKQGLNVLFQAYLYDGDYAKADSIFQLYPEITNRSITDETSLEAYLAACNPHEDYLINAANFNSDKMDFSPVVHDDKVYFASDRGDVKLTRGGYSLTGGAYLDVYEVKNDSVQKVKGDLNLPYNDGPVAFSSDGNIILVARNNYDITNYGNQKELYNVLKIFKAKKDDSGNWGDFEVLPLCSDEYSCNDPFIYKDELYFTSDMPGGFGGNDIYKVKISADVEVKGQLENLGSDINTKEQEGFPFLDEDGILYYASKGFVGFGGLDIYSATPKGSRYVVENMGYKINSNWDDFSLFIEDKENGYFASNRPGGVGSDDIYHYNIRPSLDYHVHVVDANTKKRLEDIAYQISGLPEDRHFDVLSDSVNSFDFKTFEKISDAHFGVAESNDYMSFDDQLAHKDGVFTIPLKSKNIGVYGYVYNERTGERYPSANLRIYAQDSLWAKFNSDDAGDYLHKLEREADYRIVALVDGFLPSEVEISTRGKTEWLEQNLPVVKRIELEGILYDFDKSNITKASADILDNVVRLMNESPELRIELGSHTDSRGSAKYNEALARRRSNSAVKYIIDRGIDASRLVAKSYGESQLKNKCTDGVWCSPEAHHENRRTEIKILPIEDIVSTSTRKSEGDNAQKGVEDTDSILTRQGKQDGVLSNKLDSSRPQKTTVLKTEFDEISGFTAKRTIATEASSLFSEHENNLTLDRQLFEDGLSAKTRNKAKKRILT